MKAERIIDYIAILAFFVYVNRFHAHALDIGVDAKTAGIAGAIALVWAFAKIVMPKSILKG